MKADSNGAMKLSNPDEDSTCRREPSSILLSVFSDRRQLHGFLDANKSNWADLEHRTVYYSKLIHAVFTTLGVPVDKLEFVRGSSYELKPEYTLDMYK